MKLELRSQKAKGSSKSSKLLFVHGICVGAWIWEKHFFPYFSDAGFDCYALSLRGHAGSDGHDGIHRWQLADYTEDLHTIAEKINEPLIVIGHSLGGAVVQDWIRTGGKAKAAALLASVPPWGLAPSAWRMALTAPDLYQELAKLSIMGIRATDEKIMRRGLFSDTVKADEFRQFMEQAQEESPVVGMELQGIRPFAPLPWAAPPMFVLGGQNDRLIPVDEIWRTAAYYGTRAAIIPNLSHSVMADTHWRSGADALREWLEIVSRPDSFEGKAAV